MVWGQSSGGFHFDQEGSGLNYSYGCYRDSGGIARTNLGNGTGLHSLNFFIQSLLEVPQGYVLLTGF